MKKSGQNAAACLWGSRPFPLSVKGVLLCRQDATDPGAGPGRTALLSLPPPALRQEPAGQHAEGTVRGKRAPVPGPGHPPALGLVGKVPCSPPELRREGQYARADGKYGAEPAV